MGNKVSLRAKDYEILAFYPYVAFVQDLIADYDNGLYFTGVKKVMTLFNDLFKILEAKGCGHLRDNKIAMKIQNKKTGEIFYIGAKDWTYRFGRSIYQESATEVLFDKSDDLVWKPKYTRNEQIEHRW